MTARFTVDPPLASTDTWAGRKAPAVTWGDVIVETEREAQIESIWHGNMARRDQAAQDYGEPAAPREFYHGRPGSRAERIMLDCLLALQSIPDADRIFADEFMDEIAKMFLATSPDAKCSIRRIEALLRIATT